MVREIVRKARTDEYRFSSLISRNRRRARHSRCGSRRRRRAIAWPAVVRRRSFNRRRGTERAMFITKTSLPRRTFLRGVGATVALPLLDAMVPALRDGADGRGPPRRSEPSTCRTVRSWRSWTPAAAGHGFELSPILKPLEPFENQLTVISNLSAPAAEAAMHAARGLRWLSGAIPKQTEAEDVRARHRPSTRSWRSRSDRRRRCRRSSSPPRTSPATSAAARRLQLRLPEHHLVGVADDAAADGDQPAVRVRAAVRRRRPDPQRSAGAACRRTAASSTRSSARCGRCSRGSGARDRAACRRLSRRRARDRAADPAQAEAQQLADVHADGQARSACPTSSKSTRR